MPLRLLGWLSCACSISFFFCDPSTTEIYTLSLHDALPIWKMPLEVSLVDGHVFHAHNAFQPLQDRKSTRLNSSHRCTSYAVFCLKKKSSSFLVNDERVVLFCTGMCTKYPTPFSQKNPCPTT